MSHFLLAFCALLLALGLAATPRLASAQGRSAQDAKAIETYRFTMPMLRNVLPALREMRALRPARVEAADATLYAAMLHPGHEPARRGGQAAKLPPGGARDNALLLEQHEPELSKLTSTGGHS